MAVAVALAVAVAVAAAAAAAAPVWSVGVLRPVAEVLAVFLE